MSGAQAIADERRRQIAKGYTPEHDDDHAVFQFVATAVAYLGGSLPIAKPWAIKRVNPGSGYYERRDLVRAGALIAAAIDRLDHVEIDHKDAS